MKVVTAIVFLVTAAAVLPKHTIYAANLDVRTDDATAGKYICPAQGFIYTPNSKFIVRPSLAKEDSHSL